MKIISKNGFNYAFDEDFCKKCGGKCCIGESGYIWVSVKEGQEIARFLNISYEEFINKYIIKISFRHSLKEKSFDRGYACIFFDEKKLQCSIYEVRPIQCKTFPFWDYFKSNFNELERECPGILV